MSTPLCPVDGQRLTKESAVNAALDVIERWTCPDGDFVSDWTAAGDTMRLHQPVFPVVDGNLRMSSPDHDRRFDWQLVGGESKPLYIGTAPPETAVSETVWNIDKYTFVVGPGGGQVVSMVQSRTGSWDGRGSLF